MYKKSINKKSGIKNTKILLIEDENLDLNFNSYEQKVRVIRKIEVKKIRIVIIAILNNQMNSIEFGSVQFLITPDRWYKVARETRNSLIFARYVPC